MTNNYTPSNKGQGKTNHFPDQLSKVFQCFLESPKTMKEADKACGVMRENICWYVQALRLQRRIALIRKRYCTVTKHWAGEYTTNEALFPPQPKQLALWNN